ncbi:DUF5686 and carboxypeptidase-like regulatory domain-containing protein [Segetibacter koreensis]|uniref:DUF5686 and carboxypeptidase-like regulatory domain-containing protein n=1 Tax=Segetibacter koreensis TaxID=398037 RepID=UPI0003632B90|nr:DUF5686 and carboxypeptidase-like regulatory domain-containing protein [Segetibacter koreensis]
MENNNYSKKLKRLIISFLFVLSFITSFSQTTIKGIVRDAATQQPLQSVSIYFKGGKGVTSTTDGSYRLIDYSNKSNIVNFSYVGYKTISKTIVPNTEQTIEVALEVADGNSVTVKSKKRGKYSNKNNPAVELIRRVINNKDKNKLTSYDFVQYEQYEKMELSLTNKPEKLMNNKLFKNYRFILENQDTTKLEGKALLPVFLEETSSQKYFRKNPEKTKTYVLGNKRVNFGDYVDNKGISNYLNRLYENVDIYQNNISLLTNQFLSPISDMAPTFYRFYIRDTVEKEGVKLIRLTFSPKNLNDLLFKGTIFVTLDGNYSVQKINMSISKHANLNFVRQLAISQDFEKGPDGRFHVVMSNTMAEFALTRAASGGVMGERTVSYKNFAINQPVNDSIYKGDAVVQVNNSANAADSFWVQHRSPQLTETESKVYSNIDSLQNMRSYKRFMDVATFLLAGYKSAGPYEVGPVSAFYSFNPVEGFRLRLGGRSTPKFSKSIYFENYVAYGFKDEKWKYFLSGAYSFNHKSIYSYPLNYLKLSYQQDTKIPGQELQFVQEDNFLLSFKRGTNDKWLYNNIYKAEYVREFAKNFSTTIGFKNWKQTPAGSIVYTKQKIAEPTNIPDVTTTELSAELRWAPHEQFYQGKVYRIPIINKYPIFDLKYIAGIKGLMKGQYNYHNINLNIQKRFYLSQLGYTDMTAEGGYIFGKVPFPLLTIHRANQTYSYQVNSYNLMNFMEFVSDRYAGINVDHYFNGFFFNKIPLLKQLKLREVISAKVLWGGVRDENNPAVNNNNNNDLFKFPVDAKTGLPATYSLGNTPYVEVSAAIANIFKIARVDLVKRLTYTNHPNISQWGIRTRFKFDF